jgi:formylglycine-generating enzyme required for sulfatase activity
MCDQERSIHIKNLGMLISFLILALFASYRRIDLVSEIPSTPSQVPLPIDGMVLVYVPAGEFEMGSEDGESDAKPVYTVYVEAFYLYRMEVTNAMYAEFLNQNGNQSEGGATWLDANDPDVRIHEVGDQWLADDGYANHPAVEISWYGAKA